MALHVTAAPAKKDNVARTSFAYDEMFPRWEKIQTLMEGTEAMRAAGTKYLPPSEREETTAYGNRLKRSFLHPALRDTVRKAVSKPFSKPMTLASAQELPEILNSVNEDADLAGRSLHEFSRDLMDDMIRNGKTHVLVAYPKNPARAIDKRPYLIHYPAVSIIAWQHEKDETTGKEVLTHVRMREQSIEEDGVWGEKVVARVRVYNAPLAPKVAEGERPLPRPKTTVALWEEKEDAVLGKTWFEIVAPAEIDIEGIPLVDIYTNRTGFLTADPPFSDLASLNIEHWQSSSDQKNILHVARVPILVEEGVDPPDETGDVRVVGVGERMQIPEGAKVYYAEHSGAAIDAGQRDIEATEERMAAIGHQIFTRRNPRTTATGERIESDKSTSELQEWITSLEEGVFKCLKLVIEWDIVNGNRDAALPDDLSVQIFSDFAVSAGGEDTSFLLNAVNTQRITQRTFLNENIRRGILSPHLNIEEEMSELESLPDLALIGASGFPPADGKDDPDDDQTAQDDPDADTDDDEGQDDAE